jgi:hypothetical protein
MEKLEVYIIDVLVVVVVFETLRRSFGITRIDRTFDIGERGSQHSRLDVFRSTSRIDVACTVLE